MAGKFRFQLDFQPVPAASDFRLTLPSADMQAIEASVTDRVQRATETAMRDVWKRLHSVVARYLHNLVDLEPKDRAHFVEACRDIVESLKDLNVTADPELDAMIARVEGEIVSQDSTELKDDEAVRNATIAKATEIMEAMSAFYSPEDAA